MEPIRPHSVAGPWDGFPPIWHPRCRVLILGTFPGPRSLSAGEYYAHPQNAFWSVLGTWCGFDPHRTPYPERVARLLDRNVALWDVLGRCRREGSDDSRIADPVPNDLRPLLEEMTGLRAILFNGRPAHRFWTRLVVPRISLPIPPLRVLPSTSPAAARLSRPEKIRIWTEILRSLFDEDQF